MSKKLYAKIILGKKNGSKTLWSKKNVVQKIKVQRNLGPKKFWVQKILGRQIFGKKIWLQKKSKNILVKIDSVTAEIFLIWTNVAKTNVDWTNITIMVGIC